MAQYLLYHFEIIDGIHGIFQAATQLHFVVEISEAEIPRCRNIKTSLVEKGYIIHS